MPRYFYLDADLEGVVPPSAFRAAQSTAESDTFRPGDVVEVWDHVFRWDDACYPLAKAKEWSHRGDTLADAALPAINGPLGDAGGTDLFARLEAAATAPKAPNEVRPCGTSCTRLVRCGRRARRCAAAPTCSTATPRTSWPACCTSVSRRASRRRTSPSC